MEGRLRGSCIAWAHHPLVGEKKKGKAKHNAGPTLKDSGAEWGSVITGITLEKTNWG